MAAVHSGAHEDANDTNSPSVMTGNASSSWATPPPWPAAVRTNQLLGSKPGCTRITWKLSKELETGPSSPADSDSLWSLVDRAEKKETTLGREAASPAPQVWVRHWCPQLECTWVCIQRPYCEKASLLTLPCSWEMGLPEHFSQLQKLSPSVGGAITNFLFN